MTHELFLLNPVLNDGPNVTVRKGTKWVDVPIGETLTVKKIGEDTVVGTLRVLARYFFEDWTSIPPILLEFEHDPSCRTLEGLKAAMDAAYGVGQWEKEGVTVLLLVP